MICFRRGFWDAILYPIFRDFGPSSLHYIYSYLADLSTYQSLIPCLVHSLRLMISKDSWLDIPN